MSPDRPSDPGAAQSGDESTVEPTPTRRGQSSRRQDVWIPGSRKPDEGAEPVEDDGAIGAALERVMEVKRANSREPLDAPSERASDRFDGLTLAELADELGGNDGDDDEDDE
jgi:hypothetical protein